MKKYIIQYASVVNGKKTILYHQGIYRTTTDVMNVYGESLTTDKHKALRFHDMEEAVKIGQLFVHKLHVPTIKTIRK